MDQTGIATPTCRRDGWTPERKALFLDDLAIRGNVRAACERVGLSREAAYRLRRREGLFARAWDAAILLARESVADTFGDRAIDGVLEEVWYRGELLGTKRRYDSRLMLAHMARLDKLAEQQASFGDELRFEEMLARIAGAPVPDAFVCEEGELPPDRHEHVADAEAEARRLVNEKWADAGNEHGELADEDYAAFEAELAAEVERARLEAAAQWDDWKARACAAVDALPVSNFSLRTVSESSTSCQESDLPGSGPAAPRTG